MSLLYADKTILLGVCGSVAAFRACDIASQLTQRGATVLTAMTQSAQQLLCPASFEAVTGQSVITGMFSSLQPPGVEHIAVAQRADLFLIAPATANILAKAAHGIADDWLSTTLLATRAPIIFAPAMNTAMYTHPATQANIALLKDRGALFVGPSSGNLACGDTGLGRLADRDDILDAVAIALHSSKDFAGKRVLITSGPNHEPIDPVRFIGNYSSGKMGRALAFEALQRGAEVCVVSGPSEVELPAGAEVIAVTTAQQMYDAVMMRVDSYDVVIAAAAVSDFHVETVSEQKIKRTGDKLSLTLVPNADIIAAVAAQKRPGCKVIGFAAESDDILSNAASKLRDKKLDMIVANVVGGEEGAIGADRGDAWLLLPDQQPEPQGRIDKTLLAKNIFDRICDLPD
ncbi:MAG: bifunctional phosphopantothenoylcysteine decarboxylase/phosphopantothenate--cysteine ligase CoaBC [Candidatus Hydrogenedentes bacterium]|nr:bifunctional phosphopantothenoylcysteine decarboxylase/phosphopantothenate--cysteine ligase CoaBC [Candidatus Hydrogenedentota bacterium]